MRLLFLMISGLLLSSFGALSCTQGLVSDGQTGEPIGDVEITLYRWPPPESTSFSWEWPRHFRSGQPDYRQRTSSTPFWGANFGFGGSGRCSQAPEMEDIVAPHQWYRAALSKSGYYPGYFYFYHPGYEKECQFMPCPDGTVATGHCHIQNFQLYRIGEVFPLLPDLIVDPREFEDYQWQCALVPDGPPQIGLRIATGTANVGQGSLHLIGEDTSNPNQSFVAQRVDYSDGTSRLNSLPPDSFEFHPGHQHIHFRNWVVLEALRTDPSCRERESRDDSVCKLGTSGKLSFCIMDLEPFDADIRADYDGQQEYPDPPTCDSLFQGLSPGWKDVYHSELEGQVIRFGSLPGLQLPEEILIEAEVDPTGLLEQRSRNNSIATLKMRTPENLDAICANAETTIDCRGSLPTMDFRRRQQCPDYL